MTEYVDLILNTKEAVVFNEYKCVTILSQLKNHYFTQS